MLVEFQRNRIFRWIVCTVGSYTTKLFTYLSFTNDKVGDNKQFIFVLNACNFV